MHKGVKGLSCQPALPVTSFARSHRTGSQLYQQDVILGEKYAFIQYPGGTLSERLS